MFNTKIITTRMLNAVRMLMLCLVLAPFTSCGGDDNDEPKDVSIVGKWECVETESDEDGFVEFKMILTFNNDRTGSIDEYWTTESRAATSETYSMRFNWTTSVDSNGNEILKVSYVSGDKNTELFPGSSNTVLWTRQFVLTGNILNISGGGGVWVFNRK